METLKISTIKKLIKENFNECENKETLKLAMILSSSETIKKNFNN